MQSNVWPFLATVFCTLVVTSSGLLRLNAPPKMSIAPPTSKKYCLNVTLFIKPERREEFISCIKQNQAGTLFDEPLALLYTWGEDLKEKNTFHFQEQYVSEEGFKAHQNSKHFAVWKKFADEGESPFSKPAVLSFFQEM